MAHAVVEHLEAVDVEEEDGRVRSSSARVPGDPPEAVEHELAVREAGERIVARLVRQQVLGPVTGDRDGREVRRGREQRALRRSGWSIVRPEHDDGTEPPAAFSVVDRSRPPGAKAARQEPLAGDRVGLVDLHLGDDHVVRVHTVEPRRGKAVDRATHLGIDARRRGDVEQTVLTVDEGDHRAAARDPVLDHLDDVVENTADRRTARDELEDPRLRRRDLLGAMSIGDVAGVHEDAADGGILTEVDRYRLHPDPRAVPMADPVLDRRRLPGHEELLGEGLSHDLPFVGVEEVDRRRPDELVG